MAAIAFRGGEIAFDTTGSGKAVVFLHGFLETKEAWHGLISHFSPHYKVVSIDLPGHGDSSNFGYSHSMDFMTGAVMAVLKHLKLRKIRLVGHSMGGYVALAFADKFPDAVNSLCLFHSTAADDPPEKKKERDKLIRLVQRNKDLFIQEAIPNLFNPNINPDKKVVERHIQMGLNTSLQGIIAALEGMKNRPDRQLLLKFLPFPILYIIGQYDNVLPREKLLEECRLSEQVEVAILENSGHMGFIEEQDKTVEILKHFFRKT